MAGWCILRGPSGQEWRVKITRTPKKAFFSEGWEGFARDHGLKYLDLCVFSYSEPSAFDVLVFKMSGSEREGTYFTNKSSSLSSPLICTSSLHSHNSNVDHEDFSEGVDESEESGPLEGQQDADDHEDDSWVRINGKRKTPENIKELDDSSEDKNTDTNEEADEDEEEGGEEIEKEEVRSYGRRGRPSIPAGSDICINSVPTFFFFWMNFCGNDKIYL